MKAILSTFFIFLLAYTAGYSVSSERTIPDGKLTIPMLYSLNRKILVSYNPEKKVLVHKNTSFSVIRGTSSHLSRDASASIGSDPLCREIITIDPNTSQTLENIYQQLVQELTYEKNKLHKNHLPVEDILKTICSFINEVVFSPLLSREKDLLSFLSSWMLSSERTLSDFTCTKDGFYLAVIPIDDFITAKVGVCRQKALVTAYLIDRLCNDQENLGFLSPGNAHLMRGDVNTSYVQGRHVWNIYVSLNDCSAWHVDATWNIVKNCLDPEDLMFLYTLYGKIPIEQELNRFVKP